MAYGFEASNSSGKVTISDSFPQTKFAGKATIQSTSWNFNSTYGFGTKNINFRTPVIPGGIRPIIFVYNPTNSSDSYKGQVTSIGGGQWDFTVYSNWNADWTCEAYCFFESVKSASSDTHGLRLYGSSSDLIFDSGWLAKDILTISGTASVVATNTNTFSISSIGKPAFANHFNYTLFSVQWNGSAYAWYIRKLGIRPDSSTSFTLTRPIPYWSFTASTGYSSWERLDGQTHTFPYIDGALYD